MTAGAIVGLFGRENGWTPKMVGKLTPLQTHLHLVKLIEAKQLENEANAPPEDGKRKGTPSYDSDDDYEWDGSEDEVDTPEAFLDMFPE